METKFEALDIAVDDYDSTRTTGNIYYTKYTVRCRANSIQLHIKDLHKIQVMLHVYIHC